MSKEERSIVTFCSQLDAALGGGVPLGRTCEVCGAPGLGKTQLCLQLCVDVQIPECFGGLGGEAVFVDTEGSLVVQRVVDLAHAAVQHCALQNHDPEQQEAMKDFTMETILNHLHLMRCHDYVELLAQVHLLPDFLLRNPKVRLLVIDSLAFPFRRHFEDLSVRTRLLSGLAQQLIQIASQHSVAVVWTNQMTYQVCSSQWKLVPALGESWGHSATQRLLLHWSGTHRLASVFKSPNNMESSVSYSITQQGFRDTHHTSPLASSPSCSLSGSKQIAVDNGFGGAYGQQKAEWMVEVVQKYFYENSDLVPAEVEEYISVLLDQEFNTVVEDGSLVQLSQQLCSLFSECQQGAVESVRQTVASLAQKNCGRAKVTEPLPSDGEESGGETEAMECDAASSSSHARALPSSPPAQGEEGEEEEEEGWTKVRKKK
ncbi:unnamed protein product [Merluccius merluccius]